MTKNIGVKRIGTDVAFDGYVTKLESIMGKIKNVIVEVEIEEMKVLEWDKSIMVLMKITDGTDSIMAFTVGDRDEEYKTIVKTINKSSKYRLRGNVLIPEEDDYDEFDELINLTKGVFKNDDFKKVLGIMALEKID